MSFSWGVYEEVWSARLELLVKIAISFDPTVGSRINFCMSFDKTFSLGLLWKRYSEKRRSGWPEMTNSSKWQ